ncbi:hypothetical protein BGZ51_007008 [Haplosporangium sp. Z 767]|nr:hypothetical protein BGZ51_007008 [Haplosporangium sp. Z 767]
MGIKRALSEVWSNIRPHFMPVDWVFAFVQNKHWYEKFHYPIWHSVDSHNNTHDLDMDPAAIQNHYHLIYGLEYHHNGPTTDAFPSTNPRFASKVSVFVSSEDLEAELCIYALLKRINDNPLEIELTH